MSNRIFVYGTLKRETLLLDELVGRGRYRFLGSGSIPGRKLEGTTYPAVIKVAAGERIEGEVFELNSFYESIHKLDAYEAFYPGNIKASLYVRELATVTMNGGEALKAWVYYYNQL